MLSVEETVGMELLVGVTELLTVAEAVAGAEFEAVALAVPTALLLLEGVCEAVAAGEPVPVPV
jgi:hypothetical protein